MRLLQLELKRVLKTRMNAILLAAALVLAVLMAYFPVTFVSWTELDADGNTVSYSGVQAVQKRREHQVSGVINADTMKEALAAYQRLYEQYDAESISDLPAPVYYSELSQYSVFVNDAKEAFADAKTGMAPGVMGLTAENMEHFYDQLPARLESVVQMENGDKAGCSEAKAIALKKFDAVQKPYTYYFGAGSEALEYETLLGLLLTLMCAVIAAPVFAADAQTGAEDILLCTKRGRLHLTLTKIVSAMIITGGVYLLCGVVWIVTTNSLFGWEGTKTSLQWLVSVTSLLPYTAGQMQWICLLGNFAMFVSETVFVLAVSAWAKNNLTALSVALVSVVLPLMAFMILPGSLGEWVSTLLPAGGIGLSNALLYKMINFDFLFIGKRAFFQADVLLALAAVKIPLGIVLAVLGCRHKTAR